MKRRRAFVTSIGLMLTLVGVAWSLFAGYALYVGYSLYVVFTALRPYPLWDSLASPIVALSAGLVLIVAGLTIALLSNRKWRK